MIDDELKQMARDVERPICEQVTIQTWTDVKEGILELETIDTIPSKENPKITRPYLDQPYWSYPNSDKRFPSANPNSSIKKYWTLGLLSIKKN